MSLILSILMGPVIWLFISLLTVLGALQVVRGVNARSLLQVLLGLTFLCGPFFALNPLTTAGFPEPEYEKSTRSSQLLFTCQSNLEALARQLESYRQIHKAYPARLWQVPGSSSWSCPRATEDYSHGYTAVPQRFTVVCRGTHHLTKDHPVYLSGRGSICR